MAGRNLYELESKPQMTIMPPDALRVARNFRPEEMQIPRLSVVIPCYGVADHVQRMLKSLAMQDCDPDDIEIVFVVDGSPDETETIIERWMRNARFMVTLAVHENRGVAGALNTGTRLSRGPLINTSGADDSLSENYFSAILQAASDFPEMSLFVTRMVRINADGFPQRHPLDFKFTNVSENTAVNLLDQPEMIHLAGGVITLKREVLEAHSLGYEERLRKGFEDAFMVSQYLLHLPKPEYVLIPSAKYFYWTRSESLMAQATQDFSGKLEAARIAYPKLTELAGDTCPQWLGNLLLYDIYWVFSAHASPLSAVYAFSETEEQEFDSLSRRLIRWIGIGTIQSFNVISISGDVRAAWEAIAAPGSVTSAPVLWKYDDVRRLQKVAFYSDEVSLRVTATLGSVIVDSPFRHVRVLNYFGSAWVYEHILWLNVDGLVHLENLHIQDESGRISFLDQGQVFGFRALQERLGAFPSEPPLLSEFRNARQKLSIRWKQRRDQLKNLFERIRLSFAFRGGLLLGWRRKFGSAWVLLDGADQANDNAEHLYAYLQKHRPEINSWFVLTRDSPDWKRLKARGFRLVAFRSLKHFVLMKECSVLASSSADQDPIQPFKPRYLPKTWTYSFLQHGVTKDRIDRWLNKKDIDHFVTSTYPETESIAGPLTPYKFSTREVSLTGMPRHDRLYDLCAEARISTRKATRILVMPTWRAYLSKQMSRGGAESIVESDYVREWTAFLKSEYMLALLKDPTIEVVFLPHRSSEGYWNRLALPTGMKRAKYLGDDIQQLLAGAALVVTDYSSQAFEGAFCGAMTVYFQFDRHAYFGGGHATLPGYFDYSRDGFGPVTEDLTSLQNNIDLMLRGDHENYAEYKRRISNLYPLRDGRACERVVEEIEQRLRPCSASLSLKSEQL